MTLTATCWQCDLEIPHTCYAGDPNARWGLHDGAIAALETAQRYMTGGLDAVRARTAGADVAKNRSMRKARSMDTTDLRIPDGWTLERASGWRDIYVLTATDRLGSTTIDFLKRGFRGGAFVISGLFVGEKLTRRGVTRKEYNGRGWRQAIVDDAVAWLEGTRRGSHTDDRSKSR